MPQGELLQLSLSLSIMNTARYEQIGMDAKKIALWLAMVIALIKRSSRTAAADRPWASVRIILPLNGPKCIIINYDVTHSSYLLNLIKGKIEK